MIKCKYCGQLKPESEFYQYSKSKCKQCQISEVKKYYQQNKEVILKKAKEFRKTHKRDRGEKYYEKYIKSWQDSHPEAVEAKRKFNYLIRYGYIQKEETCAICGSNGNIHAHHPDYSKPLEVIWLCASCHKRLHSGIQVYSKVK